MANRIVEQCETSPPQEIDGHEDIFSDLEGEKMHDYLMKLWQMGLLDAQWNEDSEYTEWQATRFAVELREKGLLRAYIMAMQNELVIEASTSILEGSEDD